MAEPTISVWLNQPTRTTMPKTHSRNTNKQANKNEFTCNNAEFRHQVDQASLSSPDVTFFRSADKQRLAHVSDLHLMLLEMNTSPVTPGTARVAVCCLLTVPVVCYCISGMDPLWLYMLPHWDENCRSNLLSHLITVHWHWANKSQCRVGIKCVSHWYDLTGKRWE